MKETQRKKDKTGKVDENWKENKRQRENGGDSLLATWSIAGTSRDTICTNHTSQCLSVSHLCDAVLINGKALLIQKGQNKRRLAWLPPPWPEPAA